MQNSINLRCFKRTAPAPWRFETALCIAFASASSTADILNGVQEGFKTVDHLTEPAAADQSQSFAGRFPNDSF
jgi:hypothetical protein